MSFSRPMCSGDATITDAASLPLVTRCPTYSGNLTISSITLTANDGSPTASLVFDVLEGREIEIVFDQIAAVDGNGEPAAQHIGLPDVTSVGTIGFFNILEEAITGLSIALPELIYTVSTTFRDLGHAPDFHFDALSYVGDVSVESVPIDEFPPPGFGIEAMKVKKPSLENTNAVTLRSWLPSADCTVNGCLANERILTLLGNLLLRQVEISVDDAIDQDMVLDILRNGDDMSLTLTGVPAISGDVSGCDEFVAPDVIRSSGISFEDNAFRSLNLSSLTIVESGGLTVVSNPSLQDLSLPVLESASMLNVTDNIGLERVELPKLFNISERLQIVDGVFQSISFPALWTTEADIRILSNTNLDCSRIHDSVLEYAKSVDSTYVCAGNKDPNQQNPDPALTVGAKAGIGVGVSLGVLLLFGAVFVWLRIRKKKRQRQQHGPRGELPASEKHASTKSELSGLGIQELPGPRGVELANAERSQEMNADREDDGGRHELAS